MKLNEYIAERRFAYFGKYTAAWVLLLLFAIAIAFITRTFVMPITLVILTIISIPLINYKYFKEKYSLFPRKYLLFFLLPAVLICIGITGLYYEKFKLLSNFIYIFGTSSISIVSTKIEKKLIKLNNIEF